MSDVQKLSLAVLHVVSEFLADLPAEHLNDLANGSARLTFIPRGATEPMAPAKKSRTAAPKPSVDMSEIIDNLGILTTREAANTLMEKLVVADLRALASQLGMKGVSKHGKAELRQAIVEFTVGNRINSAAIRAL